MRLAPLATVGLLVACASTRGPGRTTAFDDISYGNCSPCPPSAALPSPIVFEFGRGPCFGRCPEYVAKLHADRTVEYFGFADVHVSGYCTFRLSEARVQKLQEVAKQFDLPFRKNTSSDAPHVLVAFPGEGGAIHGELRMYSARLDPADDIDDLLGTRELGRSDLANLGRCPSLPVAWWKSVPRADELSAKPFLPTRAPSTVGVTPMTSALKKQ